jgi:copper(I)-binding protein
MKLRSLRLAVLVIPLLAGLAHAAPPATVTHAWIRTPVPGATVAAAYLDISGPAGSRVVAVSTPAAARAGVHEMKMEGDIMRMRALEALPLTGATPVELKPGGSHLMLEDLKRPLKAGDVVPVTLVVEDAGHHRHPMTLQLPVAAAAPP